MSVPASRPLPIVLIIILGAAAYANSLSAPFIFDDDSHIRDNIFIRESLTFQEALKTPRPVVSLTIAINYGLEGMQVWPYHLFNIITHVLAALVLYGLVRRTLLLEQFGDRFQKSAEWLALAIALIWMVHPLQTESVTYTIQRAEVMMGLCYFATLYCLLRGSTSAVHKKRWYAGAVIACALGMGSKEVMVTAPVMALLYDKVFLSPTVRWYAVFWQHRYLYLGLALTWLIISPSFIVIFPAEAPPAGHDVSVGMANPNVTPKQYAMSQTGVILHYLRLTVWPHPLCLDYKWPSAKSPSEVLVPIIILGTLVAGSVWALFRISWLGFLGVWFFVILSPTSSFVPVDDLAFEHRMYLSLAAVVVLFVIGGHLLVTRWFNPASQTARICLEAAVASLVVLVLGGLTISRNELYCDPVALWKQTIEQRPENARAYCNLASALLQINTGGPDAMEQHLEEAMQHLEHALTLKPKNAWIHANLGACYQRRDQLDLAAKHLTQALALAPTDIKIRAGLALALFKNGQLEQALPHFEAIYRDFAEFREIQFSFVETKGTLDFHAKAIANERNGERQKALPMFEKIVKVHPRFTPGRLSLAVHLQNEGRYAEAIAQNKAALAIDPGLVVAHQNLGNCYFDQQDLPKALQHYSTFLEALPEDAETLHKVGVIHELQDQPAEAEKFYRKAVAAQPQEARYHFSLGGYLHRQNKADLAASDLAARQVLEGLLLKKDWPQAAGDMAWALATSKDQQKRNGPWALLLARNACLATNESDARLLDIQAAALAETGQYPAAVSMARKALAAARKSGPESLATDIEARLQLYEAGQPYHVE